MRAVSLMIGFVLLLGCQNKDCREVPKVENEVTLAFNREDVKLFNAQSTADVNRFLENNKVIREEFFFAQEYSNLEALADQVYKIVRDQFIDTLFRESTGAFEKNQVRLKTDLEIGIMYLQYYYPETVVPEIHTLVTGLFNDLYISDSVIVIGIDYFIGDEATYRPNDIPQYILKRYNYDYLAPTILKFLVNRKTQLGNENTLLSEMIDFGKVYYVLSLLMPCTPDHQIIGFTAQEMEDVKANQEIVWANFIQNELLYESSEFTKKKYMGERPNVYEIGEKCPGRIGAWVGWEIVRRYMEETGLPVQNLLSETDHHKIFSMSGYKPRNVN